LTSFILVFDALNLDTIFEMYKDHKDAFIEDVINNFNKQYDFLKIVILKFYIDDEKEYNSINTQSNPTQIIPNLYRYRLIFSYIYFFTFV